MVKKKECYTKKRTAKNGGGKYTTCVEGQKKPKRKRRTKAQMAAARAMAAQDKPAPKAKAKPKSTRQKKLSAGMSVLLTQSGFMNMVSKATITKTVRKKRFFKWELKSLRTMMKIENTNSYKWGHGGGARPHLRAERELEEIISESKVIDKKISGEMGVRGHADAIRKSAEKMLKKVDGHLKSMKAGKYRTTPIRRVKKI